LVELRTNIGWRFLLGSISSIFYACIFRTKVRSKPNSKQKKAAQKTFVWKNAPVKYWWNWHLESVGLRESGTVKKIPEIAIVRAEIQIGERKLGRRECLEQQTWFKASMSDSQQNPKSFPRVAVLKVHKLKHINWINSNIQFISQVYYSCQTYKDH